MIQLVFLIILSGLTALSVDAATSLLIALSYIIGRFISFVLVGEEREKMSRLYGTLFLVGWGYMLMCYLYMIGHGYEWLFAFDTYNSFIPITEDYVLEGQGNILRIYKNIFSDYSFFTRNDVVYWAYLCSWSVIIKAIKGTLYLGLQTSTLFIFGFTGVVLYKLFLSYGFNRVKSYSHTLVVCFCSIIFFYSSQILRDTHVLLCYLIAFYLSSKPNFSLITLLELAAVILVTCGLRIESGLFLVLTIPSYLLLSVQDKKHKYYALLGSIAVGLSLIVFFAMNYDSIMYISRENTEAYMEGIAEGSGMIARFQRIPVIGNLISIVYNASQPIPFWAKLDPSSNLQYGENASNIMNFTRIPATVLNVMTYVFIIIWLFSRKMKSETKPVITKAHIYQLWLALLFLYIQSAVISQRRLMGYYCICYLLFFLIYDRVSSNERRFLVGASVSFYFVLQVIGVLYFV